jgi:prephenate dehydrogenase (NADP+)
VLILLLITESSINVLRDGHLVSRQSDFIIYSVEAALIDAVVAEYGPCKLSLSTEQQLFHLELTACLFCLSATKVGAIVAGQTSVKAPERDAFEKYLPHDVHIVSIHSLHAPTVNPEGQALVRNLTLLRVEKQIDSAPISQILIQHRAPDEKLELVKRILAPLKSRFVHLSYVEHDEVTANTQAVTHAAFMRYFKSILVETTPPRCPWLNFFFSAWAPLGAVPAGFPGKLDATSAG